MTTDVVLRIPAIHCEGCTSSVRRALNKLPGAEVTAVDHETREARFTFDEDKVDLDTIRASLKKAGYKPEG